MRCALTQVTISGSLKTVSLPDPKILRFSTVAGHKKSISHVNALKVVASWAKAVKKTSISHKMVIPLNEALRKQIERKFRNIHALIMNNRPISDFTW